MSGIDRRSLMVMSALGATVGFRGTAHAAPNGYPESYQKVIDDAHSEGSLLIYSIMSPENWRPVIEGFNKLYPKIKVETLDLPASRESFERYLAERSTNSRTCDLIATADPGGWIDFQQRGEILDYASPEAKAWPDWSKPFPGVYTVSSDPMALIWNNTLVPDGKRPKTLAEFVELAVANEKAWRNRVTSYGVHQTTFGYGIAYAYVKKHGEKAWQRLRPPLVGLSDGEIAALRPQLEQLP